MRHPNGTPLATHYVLQKAYNVQDQLMNLFIIYYQTHSMAALMADTLSIIVPIVLSAPGVPNVVHMPTSTIISADSPVGVASAVTPDYLDLESVSCEPQT